MIYCTCGHLLVDSESSQHFHQWRQDAFSIENYVIKKVRPRGARNGKTEAQKEHFVAHNARRRCIKKNYDRSHDRFQRDSVFRDSQLKIGWTEEKCASRWINRHRNTIPIAHPLKSSKDLGKKLVSHTQQIRQKFTDETPIRLPRSSHNYEPSPPRIWRGAT